MNHLPFIAASYGLTFVVVAAFAVQAALRTRAAKRRLALLDPRAAK